MKPLIIMRGNNYQYEYGPNWPTQPPIVSNPTLQSLYTVADIIAHAYQIPFIDVGITADEILKDATHMTPMASFQVVNLMFNIYYHHLHDQPSHHHTTTTTVDDTANT